MSNIGVGTYIMYIKQHFKTFLRIRIGGRNNIIQMNNGVMRAYTYCVNIESKFLNKLTVISEFYKS